MRTSRRLLLVIASAVALSACAAGPSADVIAAPDGGVPPLHASVDDYPEALLTLSAVPEGSGSPEVRAEVAVLVADTQERQQHGLMEVTDLPDGVGMLFSFPDYRRGGFWMFQTLVPLDIAYLGDDGTILRVMAMVPCTTDASGCPSYDPEVAYQFALEVPAGWFARVGIDEGDAVQIPASARVDN